MQNYDGTLRLFTIKNVPLKVHWSFGLLISFVGFIAYTNGLELIEVFWFSLMVLSLFVCVVFHEYGHAFAARHYSIKTRDIIISPIGGIARLEKMPVLPKHELVIAIAGPLVNLVLAIGSYFLLLWQNGHVEFTPSQNIPFNGFWGWVHSLFYMNCVLFGFNLIPAFPMDGGRILRALIASRSNKYIATVWAGNIGKALSICIFIFAVYHRHPILGLISFFIFYMAHKEIEIIRIEDRLNKTPARDLMRKDFTVFSISQTMQEVQAICQYGLEQNFIVLDHNNKIDGVLHHLFIKDAIKTNRLSEKVSNFLSTNIIEMQDTTSLKKTRDIMDEMGMSLVAIVDKYQQLQGVIDRSDIIRFMESNKLDS